MATTDPVEVQISLNVRKRKGVKISRALLDRVYEEWLDSGKLPANVTIRGIFWRNPSRKGLLADWRYSEGSDESALNSTFDIESEPRGSHEDARETLLGLLREITPKWQ